METEFLYEETEDGIRVLGRQNQTSIAVVPEYIEEKPVTELGDYAFSQDGELEELYLPSTLRKIGRYAFYNCEQLKKLTFDTRIRDLGAGLFTGCSGIRTLEVQVQEQERSCLKEVLSELKQTLRVHYHGKQEAYLIFPEFYEESVENTPARILWTNTHGCGHRYRYCFQDTQFQFRDYDSLFPHVRVQEPAFLVCELAMGRLFFPAGLTEPHCLMYESYLKEEFQAAAGLLIRDHEEQRLAWLLSIAEPDREALSRAAEQANEAHNPAAVSLLMDYSRKKFMPQRKTFEL
ncbi:MAG: leucine-rich repeat domain-containing protein [Lachnospiraceae bacterium]